MLLDILVYFLPDPPVTVQFDPITYSITEGRNVEFMLVLSGTLTEDVTVVVATVDGTATGTFIYVHKNSCQVKGHQTCTYNPVAIDVKAVRQGMK